MDAAWKKIVSRKHEFPIKILLSVDAAELMMDVPAVNVFVTREEGDLFTHDTLYVDVETGLYTAQ